MQCGDDEETDLHKKLDELRAQIEALKQSIAEQRGIHQTILENFAAARLRKEPPSKPPSGRRDDAGG